MKLLHTTAAGLLALAAMTPQSHALDIGASMVDTDVGMKNIDGKMLTLDGIQGEKGTLVIFTCNHCPFAQAWQKEMVAIGNAYRKKGFGVMFINSNDPSQFKIDDMAGMQKMAQSEGYQFPYVVDATSEVAKDFGASRTPEAYLFNASGKLVYTGAVSEGGRSPKKGGVPYLKDALDALLAGTAVDPATTKAVGCSIKMR